MQRNSLAHRTISVAIISFISLAGFEALIYVNNLYQIALYIKLAFFIYFFLAVWLLFIFDLHYKGSLDLTTFGRAIKSRFIHFLSWNNLRRFQNYMILPGIIYWGAIIMIGINFGHAKVQQYVAVASSLGLIVTYSLFKETFNSREMPIKDSHFLVLTYVKLYAAWLIYAASLGIIWYYCIPGYIFYLGIFLVTFMLLYQALYQNTAANFKNILLVFFVGVLCGLASVFVFEYWNVNYFSAGLFMAAVYNLLWNLLFHKIKKTLNWTVVLENAAIFALIIVMVFGITNFKARIDRC